MSRIWMQLESFWNHFLSSMGGLSREKWIVIFVGALILGFICLRGFGSRTKY